MRVCWNRQTGTFEGRVSTTYGFKSRHSHQKKRQKSTRFLSLFHRYKSLRDFRYVPLELDMPDGSICCLTATRFISYRVLSKTKNISILRSKNIEQTKFAYRLFRINACYGCLKPLILRHLQLNPIRVSAPKRESLS